MRLAGPPAAKAPDRDCEHHQVRQRVEDRGGVPEQLKGLLLSNADQPHDAERQRDDPHEENGVDGRTVLQMESRKPGGQQTVPPGHHRQARIACE